jgi:CRISPR/Cas system-associated exonuclease Cas4 (RecB family)
MVKVPSAKNTTVRKIYDWYETKKEDHREHLGASLIGHMCHRYLWLTFRWAITPEHEGRLLRLFETGHREEGRVYDNLRAIGVELHTEDEGKQIRCRDKSGHFGGSVDGIGKGFPEAPATWAVLEIKTMNDSAFKKLVEDGVEIAKPQHFAQMQVYMGLLELTRAMYIAVNKNTDAMHGEWVHFDKVRFEGRLEVADRIIHASQPPMRLSEDPAFWQCKGCDMNKLCHQAKTAEFNCRTCSHATPVEDGQWRCEIKRCTLTAAEQAEGCDDHLFVPALVHAEPIDGGENYVEYLDRKSGKTFRNGPGFVSSRNFDADKAKALGVSPGAPWSDEIPF